MITDEQHEDYLMTAQRTYDKGKRYGYLDARNNLPFDDRELPPGIPGEHRAIYVKGYCEGFEAQRFGALLG
jgi:hypothetical protein